MVLEDLGGGTVSTVSYASRDPITKTLGTFAVNLTDNPSMGQILARLRGELEKALSQPCECGFDRPILGLPS
jgi:hypothetical protein